MSQGELLVALPASERLALNSQALVDNLEAGTTAPQNTLCVQVAHDFSDEVLKALLINSLENDRVSKLNKSMLTQLAKLISKSTHFMINKVVAKLSNEEIKPLAQYIAKTRLDVNDGNGGVRTMIVYPIELRAKQLFDDVSAASSARQAVQHRDKVGQFIKLMSESAIDHFMREPTQLLKLGMISRKVVDTTYQAIRRGTASAVSKAADNMGEDDIAHFVEDTAPKLMFRP